MKRRSGLFSLEDIFVGIGSPFVIVKGVFVVSIQSSLRFARIVDCAGLMALGGNSDQSVFFIEITKTKRSDFRNSKAAVITK